MKGVAFCKQCDRLPTRSMTSFLPLSPGSKERISFPACDPLLRHFSGPPKAYFFGLPGGNKSKDCVICDAFLPCALALEEKGHYCWSCLSRKPIGLLRAEPKVKWHRAGQREHVHRAQRKLDRLHLYRAVLTSKLSTNALMSPHVAA
jgi:hypothetical protein